MRRLRIIFILTTVLYAWGIQAQEISSHNLIALDSLNSPYHDSSPFVDKKSKQLFYSKSDESGDKDVFLAEWNGNTWIKGKALSTINNRYDNEVFHFDTSGNIYFQKAILDQAGRAIFGIFTSKLNQGQWSTPQKLKIKYFNNKSKDQSFCLNKDANIMLISMESFFSHGVEDIYVSFKENNNNWTEPKNLGKNINTKYEEFTPFLDDDGHTLFFSSNGHKEGYGSKDIWVSYRLDSTWTNWTSPVNLGPSVNTLGMEMSFKKTGLKKIPFLVVTSRTSDGQSDIFGLKLDDQSVDSIIESIKPKMILETNSIITNDSTIELDSTNSIVKLDTALKPDSSNAQLLDSTNNILLLKAMSKTSDNSIPCTIVYQSRNKTDSLFLSQDSVLKISFDWLDTVRIKASSPSFLPQTKTVIFENRHFGIELQENIYLDSIEIGKSIKFEHVLFKRGTPDLLEISNSDLNYVAHILNDNQDLNIQIAGHTDNSGNAYLNLLLSEKRANTIKNYLVEKGIDPKRIETKGFGGTKPIASNESEETMKLNRRVEFKLMKQK